MLSELRKHCRASGVHRLETGEPDLAARFEELAVFSEALESRYLGKPPVALALEGELALPETEDQPGDGKQGEQGARGNIRSAWLDSKMQSAELTSDSEVARVCELAYNTIRDYRRGVVTTRIRYIQSRLAKGFTVRFPKS